MVEADLHVHTTNSDGVLELGDVPAAAKRAGVRVVAVTDHDRFHPELEPVAEHRDGVTLIHGIELRVETSTQRIDLLGYGVTPTPDLKHEVERLQTDRKERARAIVGRLEDRLGVDLGVQYREGVGRPHIARAVADATNYEYEEVFERFIGDGCPCYVARNVPDFDPGVALLEEACDLVGLAHPLRYEDPDSALELAGALDAVERYYPYEHDSDPTPVDRAITEHELIPTGGSDAHDHELGQAGLDSKGFAPVAAALSLPDP